MADQNVQEVREEHENELRAWLPWVALAVVLAVVIWLLLIYGDWTVVPRQQGVRTTSREMLEVPDVTGMEKSEAERLLAKEGFVAESSVSYDIISPPGTVSSQAPAGGSKVPRGSVVTIEVVADRDLITSPGEEGEEPDYQGEAKGLTSRPPRVVERRPVPDVTGVGESAAKAMVEAAGLVPRFMYQPNPDSIGKVYGQDPQPGEQIAVGEQVHMIVGLDR